MDRPLVSVPIANLLPNPILDQLDPLRGVQLSRQGDFHLSIGRPIRPLESVRRLPKGLRLVSRPSGHVADFGCLQPLALVQPICILAFAGNVGSMRPGLSGLAYLHAESPNRHLLLTCS